MLKHPACSKHARAGRHGQAQKQDGSIQHRAVRRAEDQACWVWGLKQARIHIPRDPNKPCSAEGEEGVRLAPCRLGFPLQYEAEMRPCLSRAAMSSLLKPRQARRHTTSPRTTNEHRAPPMQHLALSHPQYHHGEGPQKAADSPGPALGCRCKPTTEMTGWGKGHWKVRKKLSNMTKSKLPLKTTCKPNLKYKKIRNS